MAKDLEIALRIKADLEQAQAELRTLSGNMDQAGNSAQQLGGKLNTGSSAVTAMTNDLAKAQVEAQRAGQQFNFAGRSAFSLRDDFRGASTEAKALDAGLTQTANSAQNAGARYVYAGRSAFTLRDGFNATATASRNAGREAERQSQQIDKLNKSYGRFRGVAQNVGWQVQDIAVQMQMGVNPATIFAQQGSQLVSAFNPLAGAVIAVAGALGGALLPSLFSSSDAAETLNQKIRELNKEYETLEDAQRKQLINEQEIKQEQLRSEIEDTEESIAKLTARYEALVEAQSRQRSTQPGAAVMGLGSAGASYAATAERVLEAERNLDAARGSLVTKNQEIRKSEEEIARIRGERVAAEDAKNADELIKRLQEQVDTYQLAGEALGRYVAQNINADETRTQSIITLYEQIEAQKEANKAEAEAAAEAKRAENAAQSKAKATEDYVRNLERQAAVIGLSTEQLRDYENREKELTGTLLDRAEAAQRIIDAEKEKQQLAAESIKLAELEIQLLRAQGREQEAAQMEFELRYKKFLDELTDENKARGKELVDNLINLEGLREQLAIAEREIDRVLQNQQQQETSINAQREAGLITEAEARRRIVELHRETYAELERQRPLLEELAQQPGEVGRAAGEALAQLNAQAEQLRYTMDLLQSTLRNSIESGLTDAIEGLAKGTLTFKQAITELAQGVADAIIRITAEAAAQKITGFIFNRGEGDGDMAKGAAATTAAAGALSVASVQWTATATAIQAAAASLAAANASGSGGGSGGSSGGSGWAGTLFSAVASYYAADGGHITGPGTSTSDSIPAMLSDGEFVNRAAVVKQPGALGFLHDFNKRGMAALADWAPAYHNTGGLAGVPAPAMPSPTLGTRMADPSADQEAAGGRNLRIMNIVDPELVKDFLNSAEGDQVYINQVKRNTSVIKSLLGIGRG